MTFYDEMQDIASGLLAQFNQGIVSYVKITPGNGPVDNPGPPVETSYVLNGAVVSGVKFQYVQGGLALASDLQAIIAVDSRFTPDGKDFLVVDNVRYKIVNFIPKPAAGTPVAWVLIIRK